MLWNAKNGEVPVGNTQMSYASFGQGDKILVVLPGLSDGLATVKGKALLLVSPYRPYLDRYTIYMFSRKDDMPDGYSIREMAADQAAAMDALEIGKASVMGVSQGGMIAQYIAADFPEMLDRLILAVTAPQCSEMTRECVSRWIGYVKQKSYKQLMVDTAERSYSEAYLKKYRKMYPVVGALGKPSDPRRFLVNTEAILAFNAMLDLGRIACPTLVIGGANDQIAGIQGSYDLADRIKDSKLHIYPDLGHAAYEEADDFYQVVFDFLEE